MLNILNVWYLVNILWNQEIGVSTLLLNAMIYVDQILGRYEIDWFINMFGVYHVKTINLVIYDLFLILYVL